MNYEEAMEYIHGTLKFGSKLGLERIDKLMEFMGNPQKKLRFVHVAGTNGKGSTTSFISNILISAGYKTGVFTSPYIQRFTERIKINNTEIEQRELTEIINYVKSKIDIMIEEGFENPTEFEIITAVAFEYFYRNNCDIVVLEVGLGGRYDSTNVIEPPEVCVITTISLDHTDRLGNTIAEIAYQKAGIIKPNCDTVIYPQKPEAEKVFEKVCESQNAVLHKTCLESVKLVEHSLEGQLFNYKNYKSLNIRLLGDHQIFNAALAIDACEILINKGFNIDYNNIKDGLSKTTWPGRLEIINKKPLILIDGAHNFEGGQALDAALDKYFADKNKIFIVGFLRDKDYRKTMDLLAKKAKLIITVTPNNERALPSSELAAVLKEYSGNVKDGITLEKSLELAYNNIDEHSIICVFGSLYMIGEIRKLYI
ncbi:bifunctional folylpolyglutamate synthase/dihydrofolate synthase [Ruminiclostridium herbifermentans]|uniref:Dihydrofolate synthase/folylpolyglutamate synthase n=1 Tax=Ruminiclostridium herbifermentans TaxID=2488810 RepID=A0A4U7JJU6_9FIRM|nr:folylpolyglutamate synthase/dihydrofolate synthase family protein [Ruminiclostridium herbifermentans]QNU68242.1 bifunctional folylpolyglutamate synthase/dihydrofolate synthase [Ruminiclostridium herbifermentans]